MADPTGLLTVAVYGELTVATAANVRKDLLEALDHADEIEVDLAQVAEIDSAGLQIMVAAKREAKARRKALRFVGHVPAVLEALDFTELTGYLGDPVLIQSRSGKSA